MDLHIERPELNAKTAEENLATVDTWIADTSDKLNIALTSLQSLQTAANTKIRTTSSARSSSDASGSDISALVPYLGSYKVTASKIILGG